MTIKSIENKIFMTSCSIGLINISLLTVVEEKEKN